MDKDERKSPVRQIIAIFALGTFSLLVAIIYRFFASDSPADFWTEFGSITNTRPSAIFLGLAAIAYLASFLYFIYSFCKKKSKNI